jgi:hypothetical protein
MAKEGRDEKGRFAKGNQIQRLTAADLLGKKPRFKTPDDLLQKCLDYFDYVDNNPSVSHEIITSGDKQTTKEVYKKNPYTWEGLCVYLGMSTLKYYKTKTEFDPVFEYLDKRIYNQKFEGASRGDFNATIIARDLGLRDKQEVEKTTIKLDGEDRDKRIKELLKKAKK